MNKEIEKKIVKIIEKVGLHNNTWNSDVTKEPTQAILALLTSEVEKERKQLLKKVEVKIRNLFHGCSDYHPCTCTREYVIEEIVNLIVSMNKNDVQRG